MLLRDDQVHLLCYSSLLCLELQRALSLPSCPLLQQVQDYITGMFYMLSEIISSCYTRSIILEYILTHLLVAGPATTPFHRVMVEVSGNSSC